MRQFVSPQLRFGEAVQFDTSLALWCRWLRADNANPDLSQFKAHGGKLIMYHGWRIIRSRPSTIEYYED